MVCSTGHSGAVVPVLVLLFVALWFVLRGGLFQVLSGVIFFLFLTGSRLFFGPLSIVITLLGEERANLSAFCMFV